MFLWHLSVVPLMSCISLCQETLPVTIRSTTVSELSPSAAHERALQQFNNVQRDATVFKYRRRWNLHTDCDGRGILGCRTGTCYTASDGFIGCCTVYMTTNISSASAPLSLTVRHSSSCAPRTTCIEYAENISRRCDVNTGGCTACLREMPYCLTLTNLMENQYALYCGTARAHVTVAYTNRMRGVGSMATGWPDNISSGSLGFKARIASASVAPSTKGLSDEVATTSRHHTASSTVSLHSSHAGHSLTSSFAATSSEAAFTTTPAPSIETSVSHSSQTQTSSSPSRSSSSSTVATATAAKSSKHDDSHDNQQLYIALPIGFGVASLLLLPATYILARRRRSRRRERDALTALTTLKSLDELYSPMTETNDKDDEVPAKPAHHAMLTALNTAIAPDVSTQASTPSELDSTPIHSKIPLFPLPPRSRPPAALQSNQGAKNLYPGQCFELPDPSTSTSFFPSSWLPPLPAEQRLREQQQERSDWPLPSAPLAEFSLVSPIGAEDSSGHLPRGVVQRPAAVAAVFKTLPPVAVVSGEEARNREVRDRWWRQEWRRTAQQRDVVGDQQQRQHQRPRQQQRQGGLVYTASERREMERRGFI